MNIRNVLICVIDRPLQIIGVVIFLMLFIPIALVTRSAFFLKRLFNKHFTSD